MPKRRILVLADSPTVSTGFATVSKNVLKTIYDTGRYEIDMVGINYDGTYNLAEFKDKYHYLNTLVPALRSNSDDMYGREYTLLALTGAFPELRPPYDIFFTIQDHFILQAKNKQFGQSFAESVRQLQENTLKSKYHQNHFMWIGYYPVDGMLKQHWVEDCIAKTTYPVAYCDYGSQQILKWDTDKLKLKERLKIIRHGTNTKDFYQVTESERQEFRGKYFPMIDKQTYLIINVNRNQIRKDMLRTLLVYKKFKEQVPNSFLYLHCSPRDVGGNLYDYAKFIGLEEKDFAVPKDFSPSKGVSVQTLNQIYNCADAVITTTLGEGWGLSITEAMATKTPIVAPNITSIPEICNTTDGFNPETARGFTFDAGINESELLTYGPVDNEVIRPISNVEAAVNQLLWMQHNPDQVKKIVNRAYGWANKLTWEAECQKWISLFDEACEINDELRKNGAMKAIGKAGGDTYAIHNESVKKLGRNDLCPICLADKKQVKIKKCEAHRQHFL